MERVQNGGSWSLFDPADVPDLLELYGDDFEAAYIALEASQSYFNCIPARLIWNRIVYAQLETGTPFMLYSDSINGEVHAS